MTKSIGVWRSWALVAGMMIGSGIYTLPSVLAPYGSFSFIAWLITGFGALCLALCYSYLSARKPGLGGPYFYVYEAFGKYPAAIVGWGYWISLWAAAAAIALSFAGYMQALIPALNSTPLPTALLAIAGIVFFTLINLRGSREAGAVQLLMTIIKILPLLLIGGLGTIYGTVTDIPAINPDGSPLASMISAMCLLIMWAFIGVESATVPAEDIIEPEKNIPRASILGTVTALIVYLVAMFGVMSLLPLTDLQQSNSPFSDAARLLMGDYGALIITLGALFAIGGALNVTIMMCGSIMLAGARDNIFPTFFSRQNQQGTPLRALLISSTLAIILLLFNASSALLKGFETMLIISTFAVLIAYLGTGLASIKLQFDDYQQGVCINYVKLAVALLASLFSLLAIIGAWVLYQ
jgi:APA family basic amino acid/polyamine antiporter